MFRLFICLKKTIITLIVFNNLILIFNFRSDGTLGPDRDPKFKGENLYPLLMSFSLNLPIISRFIVIWNDPVDLLLVLLLFIVDDFIQIINFDFQPLHYTVFQS